MSWPEAQGISRQPSGRCSVDRPCPDRPCAAGSRVCLVCPSEECQSSLARWARSDLTQTNFIKVVPINWPYHRALLAEVNATLGSKVVATVRHRVEVTGPFSVARPGANVIVSLPREMPGPTAIKGPPDQGLIELGGVLDIDGIPAGAGKSIQPPRIAVPKAKLSTDNDAQPESPLIKKLDGSLSEVAMGGGGRYLLLTSSSTRKLFVFDANAAEIVKTISLPSPNVIVAAGASKFLIAFPEQKLIQRWDFPTLRREGSSRALPIKGPLKALVLGSDSNGPALAFWTLKQDTYIDQTVFSFIDIGSLKALGAGMVASWGTWGYVSTSGGTFSLQEFSNNPGLKSEPLHIRAAAGGALYTIWDTSSVPTGFHTLIAQGKVLKAIYRHESPGHLIAGPDGRTVFSGRADRLDVDGNALDHKEARTDALPEPSIPSCDPSFYLKIHGLVWTDPAGRRAPTAESGGVRASVHDSQSGTPLLTVVGLSEMIDVVPEDRRPDYTRVITDFTLDKRFFLIPSARLLITIPASNDRLCLRRLDLSEAMSQRRRLSLVHVHTDSCSKGRTEAGTSNHGEIEESKLDLLSCGGAARTERDPRRQGHMATASEPSRGTGQCRFLSNNGPERNVLIACPFM